MRGAGENVANEEVLPVPNPITNERSGSMKEMLVTLGNKAGVSLFEHFERLAQCGAIKSFEVGGGQTFQN